MWSSTRILLVLFLSRNLRIRSPLLAITLAPAFLLELARAIPTP